MIQAVANDKIADRKDTTKQKKDKASEGKVTKDWKEDKISILIHLLGERPSLWDLFKKDYSKRDVNDAAYKEVADIFGCNITSIKGKINGLRAQSGRKRAKVNQTKSGQSADELYISNWAHYQSLSFLQPAKSSSSKNTLKQSNEDLDEIECTEKKTYSGSKKKSLTERKIELLIEVCSDAIADSTLIESPGIKRSAFATYVEEKLSGLNKRQGTIAK